MENKKCEYCGFLNPINARFCRTCGSFFANSSSSEDTIENACINKQTEEIVELRKVLANLSNDNSSLANRFNNISDKNKLLAKEISNRNEQISQLYKEKNSLLKKVSDDENILEESKRNLHIKYIFLCVIIVVVFFFTLDSKSSYPPSQSEDSTYSALLSSIAFVKPIIGCKVEVRNAGDSYNTTIISKETTYINPQIELISLIDGYVQLDVKFYSPYGLSTGNPNNEAPDGYSYTDSIYLQKNKVLKCELSGWGNDEKGHWTSGQYSIEIYYKNELLGKKEFTIIDN